MLSAIVLAAGSSSRMGTDNKLLLPFKNKPVIVSIVETIIASGISEVIVVTGHQSALIRQALKDVVITFSHNPCYSEGMTSSIQQGVLSANGDGYMICLSDMLLITAAEYKYLEDAFEKRITGDPKCICLPQYKSNQGNPVIFSAFYKDAILKNNQKEGCKNIVQSNREHLFTVEMATPHILSDFDYPDDYRNLVPEL